MADPVLDEDYIIHLLSLPITLDHYDGLQAGAVQALIDMYDRKVTRDEFKAAVGNCVMLYAQLSKLYMLDSVRKPFEAGKLTEGSFKIANDELERVVRSQAQGVIEIIKRLQLCPTSEDKVH